MSTDQQDGGRAGDAQGPTVPRMLVGIQLHRFREAAGITPDQAAYEIRASRSKISRMENGLVRFKERDVTDLLTLYGITDEQTRSGLVTLTRQANTPGWWSKYGDIMADWFEAYLGLETAASVIRTFELQFVHGLFQTEDYARAVTMLGHTSAPAEEIDRRVSLRLKRQDLLNGPDAAAGVVGPRRGGAAPPGGRGRRDAGSAGAPRRDGQAAPRHHPGRAVQPGRARRGGRARSPCCASASPRCRTSFTSSS